MEPLSLENLLNISVNALNYMDARLTGHAERVAYFMALILEDSPRFTGDEQCRLIWTALLHNLGSLRDPSSLKDRTLSPSCSSYLFLKHFSPFPEYALPILFHHPRYLQADLSGRIDGKLKWTAECLNVIDTLDRYHIAHPEIRSQELSTYLSGLSSAFASPMAIHLACVLAEKLEKEGRPLFPPQKEIHFFLLERLKKLDLTEKEKYKLLYTLVNAMDFRSHYTAVHCNTVTRVSSLLSGLCGLSSRHGQQVYLGALLHDLGKIAIPLRVLESPGRLTGSDWTIMKAHVKITESILKGNVPEEVLQIAVRHHETLDGRGYPWGFKGPELTLPQRIVAVSDIVSALSERRSYKEPFPFEKILSIIQDMSRRGKLCPYVVDVCSRNQILLKKELQEISSHVASSYQKLQAEYALLTNI